MRLLLKKANINGKIIVTAYERSVLYVSRLHQGMPEMPEKMV